MTRRIVVAATGDSVITRRLPAHSHPAFTKIVDLIQSADVAFTNMEVSLSNYRGTPVSESGGGNLSADPRVAADLQRIGFNLTAFANNHTLNYGIDGCLATLDALQALDFPCAGAGRTLGEARLPVFLEVPAGRVGLVACASTFAAGQQAGAQRDEAPGRPGLNPQRYETFYVVDQEHMDAIKRIAERTGAEKIRQFGEWLGYAKAPKREGQFIFAGRNYIVGDHFGIRTEIHEGDLAGNLRSIRQSLSTSDLTLASIHAHEQGSERWIPADFLITFAHACIDEGADMVIGHGPHLIRGLEIYRGKPIFYSLGNFIDEYEYTVRFPADDYESMHGEADWTATQIFDQMFQGDTRSFAADRLYWETVLPLVTFEDGVVTDIKLYPVSLCHTKGRPDRGRPELADPQTGDEILNWMAELSAPFGTTISNIDGVGHVQLERT